MSYPDFDFTGDREEDTTPPPQPAATVQDPALVAVQGVMSTPASQEWAGNAATRIQDYLHTRNVADANTAMGDELVNNITGFKNQLSAMARADPRSANLALDLVPDTVGALIDNHPDLPEGSHQDTHDSIVQHIQQTIAREAVMGMGDLHEGAARDLLQSDRISSLLGADDTKALDGYITGMAMARGIDARAGQVKAAQQQQEIRDNQTLGYLGALAEPGTHDLQYQPGWAQRVMKDPALPPEYTAPMLHVYNRFVAQGGDAPETDPVLAEQLIRGVASGRTSMTDILGHAGGALQLPDALTIAGMLRPQSEGQKGEAASMVATLDAARRQIVGMDGENGAAGERAYGRFVQWLLPQYRMAGQGSLNPRAENYILQQGEHDEGGVMRHFMPTGDELLGNPLPHKFPSLQDYTQDRPTLGEIFSRQDAGRNPTTLRTTNEDQVLYRRQEFRQPRREVQDDNLGQPGNSMMNNNPERNM